MIHELLHAHMWDRLVQLPARSQRFKKENEAFIEAMARYLYSKFLEEVEGKDSAKHLLDQEKEWSASQAIRLRSARWTTDTWVWAYYLLTNALLEDSSFVDWVFTADSVETLHQEWPAMRDKCWTNAYKYNETDPKFWLPVNEACFKLNMVKKQFGWAAYKA